MQRGNKGEWSEFYTFLRLLVDKQVNAADENLQKIQNIFFPILKIIRTEATGTKDYELIGNEKVRIIESGSEIAIVDISDLKQKAISIFQGIKENTETTFSIPIATELMERLKSSRLNAGNSQKEDIVLKIHDKITGIEPEVGFSIKSLVGNSATLLNASNATNFIYEIENFPINKVRDVNAIDSRSKIRDRISKILENGGKFKFIGMDSDIFEENLRKVDTVLPEIMAELILAYYYGKGSLLDDLIQGLGDRNIQILSFNLNAEHYKIKIRNLLYSVALGMVPNTVWDGNLRAHGGYLIVREDGEIVCYHVYNLDEFKGYLFKNTKLDTPSSTRHGYGQLYEKEGKVFLKLNLQIRFIN